VKPLTEIDTTVREYRLATSKIVGRLAVAAVFLCGAGFFFKAAIGHPIGGWEVPAVFGSFFFFPGLYIVSRAIRSRLIIDGDRIEVRSALRTFNAHRNEIEGVRTIQNQYDRWTRICLKEDRGSFNVSESFTGNDDLKEWLKGLPDLEERDANQITQQISNQDCLEGTGDERFSVLKRAKAWTIGLSIAAGIVSICALLPYTPIHTPATVLLALFPPLGIWLVRRFPLLFTIFKRKADPRSETVILFVWPAIALVMSFETSDPTHLVDPSQLICWALLALACYVAALFRIAWDNPSRWNIFPALLIFGSMYSIGLIHAADTLPNHSVPLLYRTKVLKMYESRGFYLRLAPWGPIEDWDDVDVTRRVYQQVKVGDQICTELHPGFLHAPWYTLRPCPEQTGSAADPVTK
jgi:hypothetical protein